MTSAGTSSRFVSRHPDPIGLGRVRLAGDLADEQTQQVRLFEEIALAGTVADSLDRHDRLFDPLLYNGGEDGGAGRRCQFGLDG